MVAVDDRRSPQDWMCVSVKAAAKGHRLGEATRLVVRIHDTAQRQSVARSRLRGAQRWKIADGDASAGCSSDAGTPAMLAIAWAT